MSDYEQHSGKLRKIYPEEGESFSVMVERIKLSDDEFEENYIVDEENLYEIFDHVQEDEEDSFCRITPLPDGTLYFITRFYNGGTYMGEMVQDGVNQYVKDHPWLR
jgi:hypothetical protein